MKIKKKNLVKLIEKFLFEKNKQKFSKEGIKHLKQNTSIRHKKSGYEYTVDKNDEDGIRFYRYDSENPENKIFDNITHKKLIDEYELV